MRLALGLAVLGIGVSDQPNGAAPLAKKVPGIDFRYQYLTGGFGADGWSHWNPNGSFVSRYVRESRRAGITPVFTYYQALSASPSGGRGSEEDTAVLGTIKSGAWLGNRKHLARTRKSGVIAILYGGGRRWHDPEGNRRRPLLPPRPPRLPKGDRHLICIKGTGT